MEHIQILHSNPKIDLKSLPKKYLLIDTNFIIDASRYITVFKNLQWVLQTAGFTLVSIEATLIEFAKGSKSTQDYAKKVAFYESIIDTILPLDATINKHVSDITRALLKKGVQLSYVDCLLLGTTMKYKDSLYFLTKDRSDVPIALFKPIINIMLETLDNNCIFSLYEYNEAEYRELLQKRLL